MDTPTFINTQIKAGVWQGDLTGAGDTTPELKAMHLGNTLDDLTVTHNSNHDVWQVRLPIPAALINDGVQTFAIRDAAGTTLTSFSLVAGEPLGDDLRAEIALLRGELELLKKAFRQRRADT